MKNKPFYITLALLVAASIAFWIYMFQGNPAPETAELYEGEITLTMYHGEGCACCLKWAEYLEITVLL